MKIDWDEVFFRWVIFPILGAIFLGVFSFVIGFLLIASLSLLLFPISFSLGFNLADFIPGYFRGDWRVVGPGMILGLAINLFMWRSTQREERAKQEKNEKDEISRLKEEEAVYMKLLHGRPMYSELDEESF